MTVSSQVNRISYTGNGATTAFAVSFPFQSTGDLVVVETVIATGVQTTKAITTHYTVSGTPDALGYYSNGGTVTAVTAPASTVTWTIYRDPDLLQTLNLSENNGLPAESLEAQLDYVTMLVQRLHDRVNRSLRQPEGDSADIGYLPSKVSRASLVLGFDAAGDPIPVAVTGDVGTALPSTGGTLTGSLTITTASSPYLYLNTTHATNRRASIQFLKSGTAKWAVATDFDAADDTQSLTIYDGEAALNRLQITSDGTVKIYKMLSLLDGQIKFPATQNASTDAHTLDDYEEGAWTPALSFAIPGDLNVGYGSRTGTYVKIGSMVHAWFFINATTFTHTTASNVLSISGLPFASRTISNLEWIGPLIMQGITKTNYTQFMTSITSPNASMNVLAMGSGQNVANVTAADVPTGAQKILYGQISYEANS